MQEKEVLSYSRIWFTALKNIIDGRYTPQAKFSVTGRLYFETCIGKVYIQVWYWKWKIIILIFQGLLYKICCFVIYINVYWELIYIGSKMKCLKLKSWHYEKKITNVVTLYSLHPDWKWMVDICHVFAHQLLFIQCTHKPITSFNNSCHIIRRCCCKFYVLLLLFPCNTKYVYVIYVYHICSVW